MLGPCVADEEKDPAAPHSSHPPASFASHSKPENCLPPVSCKKRKKKRIKPLFFYLFGFTSVALVRTLPADVGFLCEGASRRCSVDCHPHNITAQSWLRGAHTGQTEHFQLRQERAFGNKALLIGTVVLENIFVSVCVTEQGNCSPSMQ